MSYNTPVRWLQEGSVFQATTGGTILVSAGGSLQVASQGALAIGGVPFAFARGQVGIPAGGSVMVNTGLTAVTSVVANPTTTAGSFAAVVGSIYPGGSVQFFGAFGSTVGIGPGSIAWIALG